ARLGPRAGVVRAGAADPQLALGWDGAVAGGVGRRLERDDVRIGSAAEDLGGDRPVPDDDVDDGALGPVALPARQTTLIAELGRQHPDHGGLEAARQVTAVGSARPAHDAPPSRETSRASSSVLSSDSHASPVPSTASAIARLSSMISPIRSSTVPWHTSLWTCTVRC